MKNNRNKSKGQSLVEFAISVPILMMILMGLLDLGRYYYVAVALEDAVAEAALYASVNPSCPYNNGLDHCADPNNAVYRAVHSGNDEFDEDLVEWNVPYSAQKATDGWSEPYNCQSVGCTALIQAEYPFQLVTPLISNITYALFGTDGYIVIRVQAENIILCDDTNRCN